MLDEVAIRQKIVELEQIRDGLINQINNVLGQLQSLKLVLGELEEPSPNGEVQNLEAAKKQLAKAK